MFTQHNAHMIALRRTMEGKVHKAHDKWNKYIWSTEDVQRSTNK